MPSLTITLSFLATLLLSSTANAATGYTGPGVYTLTNAANSLRADLYLGNPAANTPIYTWCSSGPSFNAHQYWEIATLNSTHVEIINYGTGSLMTAAPGSTNGSAVVTGQAEPPSAAIARWVVANVAGSPGAVTFANAAYPGSVLDLGATTWPGSTPGCGAGIQVAVSPAVAGILSQQWYLQFQAGM